MKKILVISLYDGSNEIEMVEAEEILEFSSNMERCKKGDKVVWLGEEFIYVEL
jgi:tRNA(Ile2) C34 agmatinyltransferase TiaS